MSSWFYFQRTEVFVDTKSIDVIKKRVRNVAEQDSNESRFIWKEVTLGLKYAIYIYD